jgi:hypothetical protein
MQRMVDFVRHTRLHVRLAYYPPYHSKYNPVERCWGILENHWNGALLDSVEAVLAYARTMTWKGRHPAVELVTTTYKKGVKLTKRAMTQLEPSCSAALAWRNGLWISIPRPMLGIHNYFCVPKYAIPYQYWFINVWLEIS